MVATPQRRAAVRPAQRRTEIHIAGHDGSLPRASRDNRGERLSAELPRLHRAAFGALSHIQQPLYENHEERQPKVCQMGIFGLCVVWETSVQSPP